MFNFLGSIDLSKFIDNIPKWVYELADIIERLYRLLENL